MLPESLTGTESSVADDQTTSQVESNVDTEQAAEADTSVTADSQPQNTTGDEPASLLDAIKKVVPDQASPAKEDTKSEPEADAKADTTGADKEDDKPPPFHEHPRWKKVVGERDEAKRQVQELTADAVSFRQVRDYMASNSLTADEVKQGFAIMAALKNNPAQAWEMLQPTIHGLGVFLGHDLPADLKQKVEEGMVDEATARETARLRNVSQFEQQRSQAQVQRQQQSANEQHMTRVAGSVDQWVAAQAGSDPDFKRVEPLLAGMVLQKQREWQAQGKNFLASEQAAVQLTTEAYQKVD